VERKTIPERMGLLRYTPLSVGGVVHPSPSSRPLPLPPSKFSSCKFRGWHMASNPIKSSRCALDKSFVGATNNSSLFTQQAHGTPTIVEMKVEHGPHNLPRIKKKCTVVFFRSVPVDHALCSQEIDHNEGIS
jgi:hypothetical protein